MAFYERYHIPASGRVLFDSVLANFKPGHQDAWVDFKNPGRAPLLFLSGSEDHIMPPSVQASNAKHYKGVGTITEHDVYEGRPHLMVAGAGWEEIADHALDWALANAAWTPTPADAWGRATPAQTEPMASSSKPLVVIAYDPHWPGRFRQVADELRGRVGDDALRIDHIGSTSVPGLAAKDIIDVQITVRSITDADPWPDEPLAGLVRRRDVISDHIPGATSANERDWEKRYWARSQGLHVHVREDGSRQSALRAAVPRLPAVRRTRCPFLRRAQAGAGHARGRRLGRVLRREGPGAGSNHRGCRTLGGPHPWAPPPSDA